MTDLMNTAIKTALGVAAGATAAMVLEESGRPTVARMRRMLARRPAADAELERAVRGRLDALTPHARAIRANVEHGCVLLTGDVLTGERALIVREVATVGAVDSVVDLMTEHKTPEGIAALALAAPTLPQVRSPRAVIVRTAPVVLRVVAASIGLGLTCAGFRTRGSSGAAVGALGGLLLVGGLAGRSGAGRLADITRIRRSVELDAAVVVHAPVEDVFAAFRALDNAPRFLRHVRAVERRGARRYGWTMDGASGAPLTWEVEITTLLFNRRISWRSVKGARVRTQGDVRFQRLAPDCTRVLVHITYALPFGRDGNAIAHVLGEDPDLQLAEDLARLEKVVAESAPGSYSSIG